MPRRIIPESIREGRDYASLILKDPWDMGEYSDVSQYINGDGQFNLVQNIEIQDSVFSAQSTFFERRVFSCPRCRVLRYHLQR